MNIKQSVSRTNVVDNNLVIADKGCHSFFLRVNLQQKTILNACAGVAETNTPNTADTADTVAIVLDFCLKINILCFNSDNHKNFFA